MMVNHGNSQAKRSTGIKIRVDKWNSKDGCPKDSYSDEYKELTAIRNAITDTIYPLLKESLGRAVHVKEIAEAYSDWTLNRVAIDEPEDKSVSGLIGKLILQRAGVLSDSRISQYERVSKLIGESKVEDNRDAVGKTWILRFVDHLILNRFHHVIDE